LQPVHNTAWKRLLPGMQDLVWLLLFSALAWVSPTRIAAEIEVLSALAVLQYAAPRIRAFSSPRGNVALISLKLLLGFLLIGVTGGIASSYYLICCCRCCRRRPRWARQARPSSPCWRAWPT